MTCCLVCTSIKNYRGYCINPKCRRHKKMKSHQEKCLCRTVEGYVVTYSDSCPVHTFPVPTPSKVGEEESEKMRHIKACGCSKSKETGGRLHSATCLADGNWNLIEIPDCRCQPSDKPGDLEEKHRFDSYMAVIFSKFEESLPKTPEVAALGARPMFYALKASMMEFLPFYEKQIRTKDLEALVREAKERVMLELQNNDIMNMSPGMKPDYTDGVNVGRKEALLKVITILDSLELIKAKK